jgi:deazaflavin-dependent oxidoreductase (nitroreductase family)
VTDPIEMNKMLVAEFRANGGKVAAFGDTTLLVLHSIGAKSGLERVSMMVYRDLGCSYAVFASAGGAPNNPSWFYNVVANPDVEIEVGTNTIKATARVAQDGERQRIWDAQRAIMPMIDDYAAQAGRVIPVVVLEPVA